MKPSLVIIRPEPGGSKTAALAENAGWQVIKQPLFNIEPLLWSLPQSKDYDAMMIGSANALRYGGNTVDALKNLPVYAVGDTTAQVAKNKGFTVAHIGSGGLADSLPQLEQDKRRNVLWLSGHDYVPLPQHRLLIQRIEVYASRALPMPDNLQAQLSDPAIILLHSARAATHFRTECEAANINIANLSIACFGPRVAEAAGAGWAQISTAKNHSDKALLAVAQQLCKMHPHM